MTRCEHCALRNGWVCDDEWERTPSKTFCWHFVLDWNTLTEKEKNGIQRRLMNNDNKRSQL